jgi:type VI protein secretion system component VasA
LYKDIGNESQVDVCKNILYYLATLLPDKQDKEMLKKNQSKKRKEKKEKKEKIRREDDEYSERDITFVDEDSDSENPRSLTVSQLNTEQEKVETNSITKLDITKYNENIFANMIQDRFTEIIGPSGEFLSFFLRSSRIVNYS